MDSDSCSKNKLRIHYKFIEIAQSMADLSTFDRVKIGAVVVNRKTIISSGFNQMKTHPLQKERNKRREVHKHNCSAVHAEVSALSKVRNVPQGSILYVSRKTLGGDSGMCRPCPACMSVIRESGINTIVYTTPDGISVEHLKG